MEANNRKIDERCVWMTAGLVVYKLCDREYECSLCPFDRAMRGEYEYHEKDETSFFTIELFNFYHPAHLWVRVENPSKVIVGIDNFLATIVSKIKSVVFPNPGDTFFQNEIFCHLVEERGILPLPSPISGVVLSINTSLKKKPELLALDPLKEGFLVKIKPLNFERDVKNLLSGKEAIEWLRKEEKKLVEFLFGVTQKEELGPTMQDGGVRTLPSIISELSEKNYLKLLDSILKKI